jgi:glutathione peroxidase-family protein
MARHIYDFHSKFICNRYGEVYKYYPSNIELAKIEVDIKELLKE